MAAVMDLQNYHQSASVPVTSQVTNKRKKDHTVTKVTQSLHEPDGFRMDVTVWFRHKNEALFYVDSVGHVHGPMDQHHSTSLGAMEQSSIYIPGTKMLKESETISDLNYQQTQQNQRHQHTRHQSMSALDRSSQELDRLLQELQQQTGRTQSSTRKEFHSSQHSTMEGRSQQLYRTQQQAFSNNRLIDTVPARFTTQITREHQATTNQAVTPITVHVDTTTTADSSAQLISSREKRLVDELLEARQELATLKRTRSLVDHEIYGGDTVSTTNRSKHEVIQQSTSRSDLQRQVPVQSSVRQRHHSTGFNRNDIDWRLESSLLPKKPFRALSSGQVYDTFTQRNQRTFRRPQYLYTESTTVDRRLDNNNYSAHQENMRHHQTATEQRVTERPTEVFEEIETITLQPIGKGVQDLEPSQGQNGTLPRTPRATTPLASARAVTPAQASGFSTLPNRHQQTPYGTSQSYQNQPNSANTLKGIFRQTSSYEQQQRSRTPHPSTPGSTFNNVISSPAPPSYIHSRPVSVSSSLDGHHAVSLKQVQDTAKHWYLPYISREEAINMLKYQPPGSFLVRDSTSFSDAFGLAVKVASLPPRVTPKSSDDIQSELVRHYLIEPVANRGVRLKGFSQEPVYPTLAALIHQHVLHAMALPVKLVLPPVNTGLGQGFSAMAGTADYVGVDQVATTTTTTSMHHQQQQQQQQHQAAFSPTSGSSIGFSKEQHNTEIMQANPNMQYGTSKIAVIGVSSMYDVLFLGNFDVDCSDGHRAVRAAVDQILKQLIRPTECKLAVSAGEGITLVDLRRKLFVRRNYPAALITYCGLDPKDRTYQYRAEDQRMNTAKVSCLDNLFKPISSKNHRIFAFIVRKSGGPGTLTQEGTCYVLCETSGSHSATSIVKDVLKTLQAQTLR